MDKVYIFPLVNLVLIPGNIVGIVVNDEKLVNYLTNNRKFIASLVKDQKKFDINRYGCLCEIIGMQKISQSTFIIQLKASKRVLIKKIEFDDIYPFTQNYHILEEIHQEENSEIKEELLKIAPKYIPIINNESTIKVIKQKSLCDITDIIVSIMKASSKVKQQFLEEPDCLKRAQKLIKLLEEILQRWPGKILVLKTFIPKPLITVIYLT
ncbi:MAG: LON peptidase substrate-binding domain-containing protein [Candidatus Calescibacterium sp.]|nr:LON peptidase substrate-binding domain-containing protein [Candidatus Calescibacterium sp.]MCX7972298.1 LON peptidase substrate-binding domain-containing protein [bacterium]MDW8195098.1 LON peptidase substrate-binding domain-containing protein [Candidatus Calescibacterium sp.]